MKGKGKNFTLIELLVVIAIASLVMGLMLPAFNRMITGSAVDRQTAALKLALERAQGEAASSRRYVALILPNGADSIWTDSEEKTARLGGSRMCYVTWKGNGENLTFDQWVPNTEWTIPERGASLLLATNNKVNLPETGKGLSVRWESGDDGKQKIDNLKLRNDMTTDGSGNSVDSAAGAKSLKIVSKYSQPCAIVFSPTGTMKSDTDIYLVVGETSISSGALSFPVKDSTGPVNLKVLHINRISGSVEYVQ